MANAEPLDPLDALGVRVRLARAAAGFSQPQAALRARVSIATLRLAERGIATPRTLGRLAIAFGVSLEQLRGRVTAQPVASREGGAS